MKNLIFLFVLLFALSISLPAQSSKTKKEEEKAEKTQWVIKGAKVFNSRAQVQPQTQTQAQQPQPQPQTRPTARIISNSPQSNRNVRNYDNSYEMYQPEMKSMAVMEAQEFMSLGTRNALVVEIEGADAKTAEKVWKSFVKDQYDTRVSKVKKEDDYIAEGVNVGIVGNGGGVNLYSRAEDRGRAAKFMVWMDVGNDFLSSADYPSWYHTAENMMYEYKLEVKRELVREELEEEEKNLKKIERMLKKLKNDKDRYHRIIESAQERIKKAESDILQNEAAQADAVRLIEEQMQLIQQVNQKLNSIH